MKTSLTSPPEGLAPTAGSLPRGPWVASEQYSKLRFVLSQDNEIVLKCSHLPFGMVKAITEAANLWMLRTSKMMKENDSCGEKHGVSFSD